MNDLPLEKIAADLDTDLKDLHGTLRRVHTRVGTERGGYFVGAA